MRTEIVKGIWAAQGRRQRCLHCQRQSTAACRHPTNTQTDRHTHKHTGQRFAWREITSPHTRHAHRQLRGAAMAMDGGDSARGGRHQVVRRRRHRRRSRCPAPTKRRRLASWCATRCGTAWAGYRLLSPKEGVCDGAGVRWRAWVHDARRPRAAAGDPRAGLRCMFAW